MFENRLRFLSLAIFAFALLLTGKLYMLQIVSGESFETRAEHQYTASDSYFDRGTIYFSTKDGSLVPGASTKNGYTLFLNPEILDTTNIQNTFEKVNAVTPVEKESFLSKASKKSDPYEEVSKKLPDEVGEEIKALKIPGVSVARERWRSYPGNAISAHTVGLIRYS